MSQTKPVAWFEDDPKSNTFFFRSPFRSWKFIINTILLVIMYISYAAFIWVYRDFRHPYHLVLLLLFVVYPYWWAIKRHKKFRKLGLSDELAEQRAGSPLDMLLQVADDSMNEGLRNSSTMFGIFLLTLVLWGFQHAR